MGIKSQMMKISYYEDTDSLYIDLSSRPSVETQAVSNDINLDYDQAQNIVGIDIDHASKHLDLSELKLKKLPIALQTVTA